MTHLRVVGLPSLKEEEESLSYKIVLGSLDGVESRFFKVPEESGGERCIRGTQQVMKTLIMFLRFEMNMVLGCLTTSCCLCGVS